MQVYKCEVGAFSTTSVGYLFECEINISESINMKGTPDKSKKEAERRACFELLCRFHPDQIEKIENQHMSGNYTYVN